MYYKCESKALRDFIANPVTNLDELISEPRWRDKAAFFLTLSVPGTKVFMGKELSGGILGYMIHKLCRLAQIEVSDIRCQKSASLESRLNTGVRNLERFYSVYCINLDRTDEADMEILPAHIKSYYVRLFEYFTNAISESLKLPSNADLSISQSDSLVKLFALSEVYFLWAVGALDLEIKKRKLIFTINKKYIGYHTKFWFSELCEFQSQISRVLQGKLLRDQIFATSKIDPWLLYDVSDQVLDKEFSLQRSYMSSEFRGSREFKMIRDIIALSILVDIMTVDGQSNKVEKAWVFRQRIFDEEFLEYFARHTNGSESVMGSVLGFIYSDERYYYRGTLGFKYGIRKIVGRLLFEFRPKTFDLAHVMGMVFEVHHILKRLKEFEKYGYRFYEGLKPPGTNAKVKRYDIDLVMHDLDNDTYYFVQVAYRSTLLPTYFYERVAAFNDARGSGLKNKHDVQLGEFRDNFMDESVRKRLEGKPYARATVANSYFILLTNLPYLNFYKSDGILFYEWNTLRNLLQNGRLLSVSKNGISEFSIGEKLPLHEPDYIVDTYVQRGAINEHSKSMLNLYKKTVCSFTVDGVRITYPLI